MVSTIMTTSFIPRTVIAYFAIPITTERGTIIVTRVTRILMVAGNPVHAIGGILITTIHEQL